MGTARCWIAAVTALFLIADAAAQGPPRRGGQRPDMQERSERPRPAASLLVADPFSALERELPSLRTDLSLQAEQLAPWRAFERDVRAVAEMGRSQRRRLMSLPLADDKRPTGMAVMTSLAEDARAKADAIANLQRLLEAVYATLDEKQKAMLDRRIVQSQMEPLGR